MRKMICNIPVIEEHRLIPFDGTPDNFIKELNGKFVFAYGLIVNEANKNIVNIQFKFNPYDNDYPDTVTLLPGEIFMYNVDNYNYRILKSIDELGEDVKIYEFSE